MLYHIVYIVIYIACHAGRQATCGPTLTHDDIVRGSPRRQQALQIHMRMHLLFICMDGRNACMHMWPSSTPHGVAERY